jgi:2,3-bisphosphoglycerate-independent phosphoglycerate mutase
MLKRRKPLVLLILDEFGYSVEKVYNAARAFGGRMLLTSDRGNIEQMLGRETGQPHTAHATNPVPLFSVCGDNPMASGGSLFGLASTMPDILGVEEPAEMTGRLLFTSV